MSTQQLIFSQEAFEALQQFKNGMANRVMRKAAEMATANRPSDSEAVIEVTAEHVKAAIAEVLATLEEQLSAREEHAATGGQRSTAG